MKKTNHAALTITILSLIPPLTFLLYCIAPYGTPVTGIFLLLKHRIVNVLAMILAFIGIVIGQFSYKQFNETASAYFSLVLGFVSIVLNSLLFLILNSLF
jgi:hypothetical protein